MEEIKNEFYLTLDEKNRKDFEILFQDKEKFKDIILYVILVKAIVSTLIYQFVISFRNSTRRK